MLQFLSRSPGNSNYSSDHNRKWWHIKMYPCSGLSSSGAGCPSMAAQVVDTRGAPHNTGTGVVDSSVSRLGDGTQLRLTLSQLSGWSHDPGDMGVLSTL